MHWLHSLFKDAAYHRKKALFIFLFIAGWSALSILPVHYELFDHDMKVLFTVLAAFPLPLVAYYLYCAFVKKVWNAKFDDDRELSVFALILAFASWAFAWSMVYMIFWVWQPDNWSHLPSGIGAYEAWAFLLSGSFMLCAGATPYYTGDPTRWGVALVVATQAYLSLMFNLAVFAVIVIVIRELWFSEKAMKKSKSKDGHHHHVHISTSSMTASSGERVAIIPFN